jgi:hypothetical protein
MRQRRHYAAAQALCSSTSIMQQRKHYSAAHALRSSACITQQRMHYAAAHALRSSACITQQRMHYAAAHAIRRSESMTRGTTTKNGITIAVHCSETGQSQWEQWQASSSTLASSKEGEHQRAVFVNTLSTRVWEVEDDARKRRQNPHRHQVCGIHAV